MIKFAFIIALITSDGHLQMRGTYLEQCPDEQAFIATMEKLKESGELLDWNAICVDLSKEGQKT